MSAESKGEVAPGRPESLALPVKRRGSGGRQDSAGGVCVGEPPTCAPDPAHEAERCCWIGVGWVLGPGS